MHDGFIDGVARLGDFSCGQVVWATWPILSSLVLASRGLFDSMTPFPNYSSPGLQGPALFKVSYMHHRNNLSCSHLGLHPVTDCPAYLTFSFLFHNLHSISVCDSGPLCPTLTKLPMDYSCVFLRLPYGSICFYLFLSPSIAFLRFPVVSARTCINTVLRSIERLS